jgi:ubiquinone biosynthesis protein Coq4
MKRETIEEIEDRKMQDQLQQLKSRAVKPENFIESVKKAKNGDRDAQLSVAGALVWAGFAAPGAITPIYSALADVYLSKPATMADLSEVPATELPETFWQAFDETLTGPEGGYDAISITSTVASLGGAVAPDFHDLVEAAAVRHPGADHAESKPIPDLLTLNEIEPCPKNTLGNSLYRMLVDNGYDAEVLDREAIGLSELKPAVRYLNTRILQMHDVWHLVAGYQTTSLHEISISGFQLAQFGHNYSAMFLATVSVMSQRNGAEAFNMMMQINAESWRHGSEAPSLMEIPFEEEWNVSIDDIRIRYGIKPFEGSFPPDLFEQLKAAGAA